MFSVYRDVPVRRDLGLLVIQCYYKKKNGLLIFPPLIKSIISHVSIIMKRIRVYCSIFGGIVFNPIPSDYKILIQTTPHKFSNRYHSIAFIQFVPAIMMINVEVLRITCILQNTNSTCFRPDKTRAAASVLNGFKTLHFNEPFYEFIGEVIQKINLLENVRKALVKTSEKFIKSSELYSDTYNDAD